MPENNLGSQLPTEPSLPPVNQALPDQISLNKPATEKTDSIVVDSSPVNTSPVNTSSVNTSPDDPLRREEQAMGLSAPGVTPANTNTGQAIPPATEVGSAGIREKNILEIIGSH